MLLIDVRHEELMEQVALANVQPVKKAASRLKAAANAALKALRQVPPWETADPLVDAYMDVALRALAAGRSSERNAKNAGDTATFQQLTRNAEDGYRNATVALTFVTDTSTGKALIGICG
jgi:hypothetical protein